MKLILKYSRTTIAIQELNRIQSDHIYQVFFLIETFQKSLPCSPFFFAILAIYILHSIYYYVVWFVLIRYLYSIWKDSILSYFHDLRNPHYSMIWIFLNFKQCYNYFYSVVFAIYGVRNVIEYHFTTTNLEWSTIYSNQWQKLDLVWFHVSRNNIVLEATLNRMKNVV